MKSKTTVKLYKVGELALVNGRVHRIIAVERGDDKACSKALRSIASSRKGYG